MLRVRMVSASGCRMCRGPSRGLAQSSCTPLPMRCAAGSIEMGDWRWAMAMGGRGGVDACDAMRGCRLPVVVVVVDVDVMLRCTCTCTCNCTSARSHQAVDCGSKFPPRLGRR